MSYEDRSSVLSTCANDRPLPHDIGIGAIFSFDSSFFSTLVASGFAADFPLNFAFVMDPFDFYNKGGGEGSHKGML